MNSNCLLWQGEKLGKRRASREFTIRPVRKIENKEEKAESKGELLLSLGGKVSD